MCTVASSLCREGKAGTIGRPASGKGYGAKKSADQGCGKTADMPVGDVSQLVALLGSVMPEPKHFKIVDMPVGEVLQLVAPLDSGIFRTESEDEKKEAGDVAD